MWIFVWKLSLNLIWQKKTIFFNSKRSLEPSRFGNFRFNCLKFILSFKEIGLGNFLREKKNNERFLETFVIQSKTKSETFEEAKEFKHFLEIFGEEKVSSDKKEILNFEKTKKKRKIFLSENFFGKYKKILYNFSSNLFSSSSQISTFSSSPVVLFNNWTHFSSLFLQIASLWFFNFSIPISQ